METKLICYGEGTTAVTLELKCVGKDYFALLTAGTAHIGATALAVPCPPNAEGITASVSVLTVPGHRDDIPARNLALLMCKALKRPVTLTVGMHIDQADQNDIITLLNNAEAAVKEFITGQI